MKIFHFKDKIDSLPKSEKTILSPIHIRIKPINSCNHNCHYCSYRIGNVQLGKDMKISDHIPKEKMGEIIDDLIEMGVKAVTFSGGGEPLIYPYFLEMIKKLANSGIKFASLTNGSMLKGEIAEVFSKSGTWIRISMDGWDDKSYTKSRGVGDGEFSKIIKNIQDFVKLNGKCKLGVSIIANKYNASHLYELIKKLKNVGISSVKIAPVIISNSSADNNSYHKYLFDVVKDQIKKAKKNMESKDFEISDSYNYQLETFKKNYNWCPYLQVLPVIGADCNIYPCQDKAYNLDEGLIGSIKNQRFKEFWFSNKKNFFKINPKMHCNHHCISDAKNTMILEYLDADKDNLDFV